MEQGSDHFMTVLLLQRPLESVQSTWLKYPMVFPQVKAPNSSALWRRVNIQIRRLPQRRTQSQTKETQLCRYTLFSSWVWIHACLINIWKGGNLNKKQGEHHPWGAYHHHVIQMHTSNAAPSSSKNYKSGHISPNHCNVTPATKKAENKQYHYNYALAFSLPTAVADAIMPAPCCSSKEESSLIRNASRQWGWGVLVCFPPPRQRVNIYPTLLYLNLQRGGGVNFLTIGPTMVSRRSLQKSRVRFIIVWQYFNFPWLCQSTLLSPARDSYYDDFSSTTKGQHSSIPCIWHQPIHTWFLASLWLNTNTVAWIPVWIQCFPNGISSHPSPQEESPIE